MKLTLRSQAAFAIVSVSLFVSMGFSQVLGSISGAVVDPSSAAVPAATVTVTNAETGLVRSAETDERGYYRILSLPVGRYAVKVEKSGFRTAVKADINLVVGQDAVIDVGMELGNAGETVRVEAEAPAINVTTTSIAGLVSEQAVKDLPLNGRSFDNLITLNPGTANTTSNRSSTSTGAGQGNNFSISGNREDYNLFLLNGIEYTGVSTADVVPGGLSGQLLGVDAVREFNVVQNTYGAEYGKRPGGQINLVTMSGTNAIHGTLFEFVRNSAFDARNFFDHTIGPPPFKRNQFGGSAGGPIRKDRTFIFGNYEGFRQRLAVSQVAVVPDDNARKGFLPASNGTLTNVGLAPGIAPYFSLWPEPNGGELGGGAALFYGNPAQSIREDFGNLRVDQYFSKSDVLSGVYTIDDGNSRNPGSTAFQQNVSQLRSQVASVQETHSFSSNLLNIFRAGFTRAKWLSDAAPPVSDPSLSFVKSEPIGNINIGAIGLGQLGSIAGAGANGSQEYDNIARNLYTITDNVLLIKGSHAIEVGGFFQKVQSNDNAADQRYGVATFADLQSFMLGKATQVVATLSPISLGWRQTAGAWYAQDTIQLSPRLTLTLGVRHEFNNGWNSPAGLAGNFIPDANGILMTQPRVGKSVYTTNNARYLIGPRAGIAWKPFGNNTAIHAGYGMYYEQLDYMGACCDAIPLGAYNNRVALTSPQFPVVLATGENIPGSKIGPLGVQPDLKMPTVQEYSLKVDQSLSGNVVFSAGYVGEHGYHLLGTGDANTALPTSILNGSPFFAPKSPRANPNLSNSRYEYSNAASNYNALQVDLNQRFSHGLQWRVNYTFSKSLDDHSSSFLGNEGLGGATTYLDPRNQRLDWGPSNFNVTHRVSGNFSYELPFGNGKALLGGSSGIMERLVGGWQWNAIITAQTGFPFTPLVGFNQSGNGDTRNPDRVSLNPNFSGPIIEGNPNQWFNPAAFLLPPAGAFGNAGRDILTGPGLLSFDTSMFKNFKVGERASLQFRAEFFNAINHTNFGWPVITTFTSSGGVSPSAGLITSTQTTSRQIQLALKLKW